MNVNRTQSMKSLLWLLAVEAVLIAVTVTVALDIYAHQRVQEVGGVNAWGYRGPVAHAKAANEIRIAIVGGTRAFGWGQPGSALTTELRRQIMLTTDQRGGELRSIIAVNLGRIGALPDSYPATLDHYGYLQPDYICIYDDLGIAGGADEPPSGVYSLTGYAPVLPLVLREKGLVWQFGDVNRGYAAADSDLVASGSVVRRAGGTMLQGTGRALGAADRMLARAMASRTGEQVSHVDPAAFAQAMMSAIETSHRRARGVVVVFSPAEKPEQVANARALDNRMKSELASPSWLRIVDLGQERSLYDAESRVDGWNFGGAATALIAERMAPAVLSLIR